MGRPASHHAFQGDWQRRRGPLRRHVERWAAIGRMGGWFAAGVVFLALPASGLDRGAMEGVDWGGPLLQHLTTGFRAP
jgi:hypothetical protein